LYANFIEKHEQCAEDAMQKGNNPKFTKEHDKCHDVEKSSNGDILPG
jgi:hypothetical protein